ncbi:MAG: OmpH family outer membrane protein [Gammaproteobacteria bacterium]|nr:OmpH family outer membrane protein [Gammaproteobacteria bacterium]NIM73819.1 OmpH family outer membrane protein [Gammaproteobacteria bacterium]NIN39396.1 OmpH family outer membrane protein [Gammaproteobacteria bacterium]NIO25061.1 OmpH family outer membrane protein [Gammaproteobacteria bacterium]NIO65693.1 OmpH family outer membrane protein [Gammaproteobacteria bacterium]
MYDVKHLRLVSLARAGIILAAGMLAAQAASAEVKVGFVNVARVLELAPQAEAARNRIEREFAPKDRELLQQQKDVRGLEDRLVKNAAVLSEAERQRQENDIRANKRELRRAQDEFREDLNLRRSQELSKLQQKVTEVIQELAQGEKYDLIVSDGVIFAGERVDITEKVLERLRTDFKKSSQ